MLSSKIFAMKISISLPDELVHYLDGQVENRSQLIESLLRSWQRQHTQQAMVEACLALDELEIGWGKEWEQAAITDWEVSG
jgi:Arc/MetJ-type ribon-helix-helix transcriptional regulator